MMSWKRPEKWFHFQIPNWSSIGPKIRTSRISSSYVKMSTSSSITVRNDLLGFTLQMKHHHCGTVPPSIVSIRNQNQGSKHTCHVGWEPRRRNGVPSSVRSPSRNSLFAVTFLHYGGEWACEENLKEFVQPKDFQIFVVPLRSCTCQLSFLFHQTREKKDFQSFFTKRLKSGKAMSRSWIFW